MINAGSKIRYLTGVDSNGRRFGVASTMFVEGDMAETTRPADRERMRQWVANWRVVNEAQDELIRSEPTPNSAACLEAGLSLIGVALRLRESSPPFDDSREADDEPVRRTWRRLRAARVG